MNMKTRLIILFLLTCGSAFSQGGPPPGKYTLINQQYNWLGGYFRALGLPVGCDTANAFFGTQWRGAGAVYFDSCASKQYIWTGLYWKEQATGGGLTDGNKGQITVSGSGATWNLNTNVVSNSLFRQSAGLSIPGRSANSTGNVADITAGTDGYVLRRSGTTLDFGQVATGGITDAAITYAKIQNVSAVNRVLGRIASSGPAEELTGTQLTTLLDNFSSSLKGLAPASGGGTANFLRADGTWATPPGSGLTDGDKGDVTVASSGSSLTVDNQAVSFSKVQNIATARILGRTTASSGSIEELTAGYGIDLSSGSLKSDTATALQPKNLLYPSSVEREGVTVRLQNDANTDSTVYTNLGGKGWGNAAIIDKTGGTPGQVVVWLGGKLFGLQTITGGSASQPYQIKFRPGLTPDAPANGATYIVCDSLTGKGVKFYRDGGDLQYEGTETGEYYISNDTLYVGTPFYAGERDLLEIWDNPFDSASICPPPAPGATWVDLTFGTNTGLVNTSTVWTANLLMNWDQFGLDALTLTGDGKIAMQFEASDGHECILGFDIANTSKTYTSYDYGVFLDDGGLIYRIVNGTPTSLGVSIADDDWIAIDRTGNTFSIVKSTDNKATWSAPLYTFAATSTATHYVNLAIFDSAPIHGKCYHPQGYGLQ